MKLRRRRREKIDADAAQPPDALRLVWSDEGNADAAIESWLTVLVRLLRLPAAQRAAIRQELREHIRERVRDLLLHGHGESKSVRLAIEELGEIAQLARRFEAADRPRTRRIVMQFSLIALGAAAVLAVSIMSSPSRQGLAWFEEGQVEPNPPAAVQAARLTLQQTDAFEAVVDQMIKQHVGVSIDWSALDPIGFARGAALGLSGRELPVVQVLESLAQRAEPGADRLAWRFDGDMLVVNTAHYFDRREITLVSYDIADVIESMNARYQRDYEASVSEIFDLLTEMVEPQHWQNNGGELASCHVVAGKMFIQAPPRMHAKIDWILQQLRDGAENAAPAQGLKQEAVPVLSDLPIIRNQSPGAASAPHSGLQPGNWLTFEAFGLFEHGQWYRTTRQIDETGILRLPVVGDLPVSGRQPREVEDDVRNLIHTNIGLAEVDEVSVFVAPNQAAEVAPSVAAADLAARD